MSPADQELFFAGAVKAGNLFRAFWEVVTDAVRGNHEEYVRLAFERAMGAVIDSERLKHTAPTDSADQGRNAEAEKWVNGLPITGSRVALCIEAHVAGQRLTEASNAKEVEAIIDLIPKDRQVRSHEGLGSENKYATLAVSLGKLVNDLNDASKQAAYFKRDYRLALEKIDRMKRLAVDAQSLQGMKIFYREDDNRFYVYAVNGRMLWSGEATYNAAWRCVCLVDDLEITKKRIAELNDWKDSALRQLAKADLLRSVIKDRPEYLGRDVCESVADALRKAEAKAAEVDTVRSELKRLREVLIRISGSGCKCDGDTCPACIAKTTLLWSD